jgi:hypothetical protein
LKELKRIFFFFLKILSISKEIVIPEIGLYQIKECLFQRGINILSNSLFHNLNVSHGTMRPV